MSDPRTDEVRAAIQTILFEDWDPIGCGVPRDEYDSYIPEVYLLLYAGWDAARLEAHLHRIESERMGLSGKSRGAGIASRKLAVLDISPGDRTGT